MVLVAMDKTEQKTSHRGRDHDKDYSYRKRDCVVSGYDSAGHGRARVRGRLPEYLVPAEYTLRKHRAMHEYLVHADQAATIEQG